MITKTELEIDKLATRMLALKVRAVGGAYGNFDTIASSRKDNCHSIVRRAKDDWSVRLNGGVRLRYDNVRMAARAVIERQHNEYAMPLTPRQL